MARKDTPKKKTPAAKKSVAVEQTVEKSQNGYANMWTPISGGGQTGWGSYDVYGAQQAPSAFDLLGAYEDVIYACVNLISHNVADCGSKLKLCATTRYGEPSPKSVTRSIDPVELKRIEGNYGRYTRKALNTTEVVDHPLLDLLHKPNPSQSFNKLLGMTQVYLELCGSAFWYLAKDELTKEVREIWLLPSQNIGIELDDNGKIEAYTNQGIGTDKVERLAPEDVLHFQFFNPADPYTGFGISPVRAVWQRVMLLRQEQSSWQAVLTNMAFPSAMISAADPNTPMTEHQAERLQKQMGQVFSLGNQGGVWVVQDAVNYQAITTPPKDLAALTMYETIKDSVCNAYAVPRPLLDMHDSNFASADTAIRFFQMNCLKPRVTNLLDSITHRLCPDRLFLATSEIVKPDETFELQKASAMFQSNAITQNEYRLSQGFPPLTGGNRFLYQMVAGGNMGTLPSFQQEAAPDLKKKSVSSDTTTDPTPLARALAEIFGKLKAELMARALAEKEAPALVVKAFIPVSDWTAEIAQALTPILRVYFEEGSQSILGAIGGDPDLKLHKVQNLNQAVNEAALALAQSTLDAVTTSVTDAVEATREAIREGLSRGEAHADLTTRLEAIFTDLSEQRVYLIAETESARAKHAGELVTIRASGVECRKKWLADNMACPKCAPLNGVTKELDQPFAVDGSGVYAVIQHPPFHPACRCTLQYDFIEE